ncbi:MAG: SH3 domain-containing protein [Gemmatimonadaceae bacterium]
MRLATFQLAAVLLSACATKPVPAPVQGAPVPSRTVRETVTVRDAELERRLSRLELRVIEKETQVEELETRLDDARDEVVRTMAKLQTIASRAEAASSIAEADVALQSLRSSEGSRQLQEVTQATKFVQQATAEFNKANYGGALYLANQAKSSAVAGRARLAVGNRGATRQGETAFALPIRLKAANRGNVREGPGTNFQVVFAVEPGNALTGFSYTEEWVRVSDDSGRSGWIFRSLIARP